MAMLVLPGGSGESDVTKDYVDVELAKKADKITVEQINNKLDVVYVDVEG